MKEHPFITFDAGTDGYIRADRIESVVPDEEGGTCIRMFAGDVFYVEETPDEVFAKMADALHMVKDE